MEDDLFGLRREMVIDGRLNESFFVFEVVEQGCFAVDGTSLIIHAIDHPGPFGYVAVNKIAGATYRLRPDQAAITEFNRLIRDVGIDLDREYAAVRLAALCLYLVKGPAGGRAFSSFQLKQLAERSFYRAFPDRDWSKPFQKWWSRFQKTKELDYDMTARRVEDGWLVTGKSFQGYVLTIPRAVVSGIPAVVRRTIHLSSTGRSRRTAFASAASAASRR
jgi:hypothetical protein